MGDWPSYADASDIEKMGAGIMTSDPYRELTGKRYDDVT